MRITTFVASLTLLAMGTAGLVHANEASTIPDRPKSGPVFAPSTSSGLLTSAGAEAKSRKFWSDSRLSKNVSAYVVDADTGLALVEHKSNAAMTPASTIKLVTAAAALERLGGASRFSTRVTQAGNIITVVGGGDPTLTSRTANKWRGKPAGVERPPSLDELAAATAQALGTTATAYVVNVDTSFFQGRSAAQSWPRTYIASGYVAPVTGLTVDFGVTKNDQPLGDPAKFAGKYFASALRKHGVQASFGKIAPTQSGAREVAHVDSATVTNIVERMLTTSNNTMAEYLAHHVGRAAGDSTFEGSAKAVKDVVSQLGIVQDGLVLHDGSGLSHDDKVSARTLVDVLYRAQHDKTQLWPILSGLPIAGVSGTLAQRYSKHANGRGYVQAKTGTLSGVVSLAGTVVDESGDVLIFAVMANRVSDTYSAELAVDSLLQTFAGCGCK